MDCIEMLNAKVGSCSGGANPCGIGGEISLYNGSTADKSENYYREDVVLKIMEGDAALANYVERMACIRAQVGHGFETALRAMREGKRVTRAGWNGQGMFAYLVPAASYPVQTGAAKGHFGEASMVPYRAYFALKTAQGDVATWNPSNSDILADDWYVL